MRILCISHSSPLKEGGAETRTREVAFRLAAQGHDVTVLCGKTHFEDPEISNVNGVKFVCKKTLPDFLLKRYPYPHYVSLAAANLFLMFYLRSFFKDEKYDLIREDICPFPPSFLLSLLRLRSKRIAITHMLPSTLRNWIKFYGPTFGPAGFLMNRLLRAGVLKYDRIISDSKWFAEELRQYPAVTNKVVFVPNGVNLLDFKPVARRAMNGEIRLLSVARLVETKGHRYLLEALSRLVKDYPGIKLDVLGNGQLREQLVLLANDLGLSTHVRFRPPVSHEEMPRLYNDYDFFVMPSLWEGLPVSLIEAMASKLPIVASDIPAITDVVDSASATLFPQENPQGLAEKIRWAIEHPVNVAEYAERAYEMAQMYDWDVTARQEIEEE